jgi:hypothetical protein
MFCLMLHQEKNSANKAQTMQQALDFTGFADA